MYIVTCFILGLLGLCLGSFAGAQVWRLRYRQLREDKVAGEKVNSRELKQLAKLNKTGSQDRSLCLHCGHQLAWYDLVPLASWISTRGRCRYCGVFIGWFEPLIELAVAASFITMYLFWPVPLLSPFAVTEFAAWLLALTGLAILFAYDLRWMLLPDRVMWPVIAVAGVAAVVAVVGIITGRHGAYGLLSLAGAVFILSGIYLVLWLLSRGKWIGFGDVKLGLALGLLLGDYRLAIIALFMANALGCVVVFGGMVRGKLSRKNPIAFGPFLIIGAIVAQLAGPSLLEWYMKLLG